MSKIDWFVFQRIDMTLKRSKRWCAHTMHKRFQAYCVNVCLFSVCEFGCVRLYVCMCIWLCDCEYAVCGVLATTVIRYCCDGTANAWGTGVSFSGWEIGKPHRLHCGVIKQFCFAYLCFRNVVRCGFRSNWLC